MWIAYTADGVVWGTGQDEATARNDAVQYMDFSHEAWDGNVAQLDTIPASPEMIAMVENLGGDPDDWRAQGVEWAIVNGVAEIIKQN